MSSNSDDIQAAGSDTRPPMLDRTDYESWSQRIRLYCRGKENGLQILQSIDQGPFELGTTRDALGTTPEGGVLLGPERPRTYEDLSDTEKKRYDADSRPVAASLGSAIDAVMWHGGETGRNRGGIASTSGGKNAILVTGHWYGRRTGDGCEAFGHMLARAGRESPCGAGRNVASGLVVRRSGGNAEVRLPDGLVPCVPYYLFRPCSFAVSTVPLPHRTIRRVAAEVVGAARARKASEELISGFAEKEGVCTNPCFTEGSTKISSPYVALLSKKGFGALCSGISALKIAGTIIYTEPSVRVHRSQEFLQHNLDQKELNIEANDDGLGVTNDYDCDIRYHPGKSKLCCLCFPSRKEREPPLRVRAWVMTYLFEILPQTDLKMLQTRSAKVPRTINSEDVAGNVALNHAKISRS
ncbi:hypothetical protein Tco_0143592 [Tanacetum coccineum]